MPEAVHIPWQPIGGGRASEAIYDQLRELITSGVLKPGDRLPSERAMMEQLHRSRPTIREALRMLEQGGYVASTHGASGAVVQELTIDGVEQPLSAMLQLNQISLEELGEYRAVNDGTIAGWAARRRTDEDLAALDSCLTAAEQALGDRCDRAVILKWLKNFYRRFFAQQFKRSCLPDGPKVGSLALSPRGDWRMPSDAVIALWRKELEELEG